MAKLQGPLFSVSAHGKLANSLVYSRRKSGNVGRRFNMPGKYPTLKQWTQRHIIGLLTAQWQVKSPAEKSLYEILAKASDLNVSGFNYFIHVAQADLRTHLGLCAYWSMNESTGDLVFDYSGNGNHGTLMPTYPSDCPSRVRAMIPEYGNALTFNGTSHYVDFGAPANLALTDKITTEAWVTVDDLTQNGGVLNQGLIPGGAHFTWYLYGDPNQLYLLNDLNQLGLANFSAFIREGEPMFWSHVYDITNLTLKFYINAIEMALINVEDSLCPLPNKFIIGSAGTLWNYFKGTADEGMVFNRLLSQPEIKKHYDLLRLNKERQPLLNH